jgi:signal recognition particle subunit SRP54
MTPLERADPGLIDGSRRNRIANGSGVQPGEVKQLIDQFRQAKQMMQRLTNIPGVGRKMKKAGKKGQKGGGRTTPKGGGPKAGGPKPPPFTLPGLN